MAIVTKPLVLDETVKEFNQNLTGILNNITKAEQSANEAVASATIASASATNAANSENEAKRYRDEASVIVTPDGLAGLVAKNSDDIATIKDAISIVTDTDFTNGLFLNINGAISSNATAKATENYIEINTDRIFVSGFVPIQHSKHSAINFYSNNTSSSSIVLSVPASEIQNGVVYVPANAKYMRFSSAIDSKPCVFIRAKDTFEKALKLEKDVSRIDTQVNIIEPKVETLETVLKTENTTSETKTVNRNGDFTFNFYQGKNYKIKLVNAIGYEQNTFNLYLYKSDNTYIQLRNESASLNFALGDSVSFVADNDYVKLRFYNTNVTTTNMTVEITEDYPNSLPKRVAKAETLIPKIKNLLIIGDSYSQMGYWVNALKEYIEIENIVNLGVSSASLKDKYADRTQYPYNDRPLSNDTRGGNVNTFGSQIAKLKRLMKGTDLDSGEKKIYTNETEYPQVIVIEGGKNDSADSDAKVNAYMSQFISVEDNVYVKDRETDANSTATKKRFYNIPNIENVDRTSFAGAMRYLYEELHGMFPNALIFFVTPSGLSYTTAIQAYTYRIIAEQMSICAEWLGQPIIDWAKNGRLNYIDKTIIGDGTANNPYVVRNKGQYTDDALHPNTNGAKLLALACASELSKWLPFVKQ